MSNVILTPVTLWKDFDDSLPLREEIISEREENGVLFREIYFLGRETQYGRVKIYAKYYTPVGEQKFPAVMVLFEAGFPADYKLVEQFIIHGYAVFCVDYCGDMQSGRHTIYPRDIDYANYARAGRHMDYADDTAKETSWYEWAAVARYAARYLSERSEVTKIGAIGLRTGGEILWKIAPYAPLSCMISVCAAGWLAYRDMEKFVEGENRVFNEERHRFIAGIDSQSYAPHVKCPVLLLAAINDKKSDYDRVYDTFQQINPEVEKAFLYSAHGNGLIGSHSLANIFLFLDKFVKGRSVYLSKPVRSETFEEDGDLKVKILYDNMGDPDEYGIFYTEKLGASKARDWARIVAKADKHASDVTVLPLSVYEGSRKALMYTFVRYSNGFSVTSKIQEVTLHNPYRNSRRKTRVVYSAKQNGTDGFSIFRRRASSVADCFTDDTRTRVEVLPGYGSILGACCDAGLISYRVSEPRYEPPHGAMLKFDAYGFGDDTLTVGFFIDADEKKLFSCSFHVEEGGKWKKFVCKSVDFKSDTGVPLSDFSEAVSVVFSSEKKVLINNIIWL